MKRVKVWTILFLVHFSLAQAVSAKECKCEKHSAKATGSGSCSLTEDSSYCDISYTGGSSHSKSAQLSAIQSKYQMSIKPEDSVAKLDALPPSKIPSDEINTTIVAALISALPAEMQPDEFQRAQEIIDLIFNNKKVAKAFSDDGCIDIRGGQFRFYLISKFSSLEACGMTKLQ